MYTVFSVVTLVELGNVALERFHLVVQSPLLFVDERLNVDGRSL